MSESTRRKRQLTKYHHDNKSKNLPALEQVQPTYVWYQPVEKETPWDPGTVKHVFNNQSYIASTDGYDKRRNHIDIREWICFNGEIMTNSEHNMLATSDPINKENPFLFKEPVEQSKRKKINWRVLNLESKVTYYGICLCI